MANGVNVITDILGKTKVMPPTPVRAILTYNRQHSDLAVWHCDHSFNNPPQDGIKYNSPYMAAWTASKHYGCNEARVLNEIIANGLKEEAQTLPLQRWRLILWQLTDLLHLISLT